jgi:hypothetical protein
MRQSVLVMITARDGSIHKRLTLTSLILEHLILGVAAGVKVDIRLADEGMGP